MDFTGKVILKEEWKFSGQANFYALLKTMIWNHRPVAIVHGTPVRYAAVIASQSKMIGVIDLAAEEAGIYTVPCVDNTCKKAVLGNGAAKKPEIMAHYNEESEHIADCLLFGEYFLSFQDHSKKAP